MRFDEQRRPAWTEQGDEVYGHTLSPVERFLDALDSFPRARRLTDLSAHRTPAPGRLPSSLEATGPDFPDAA